MAPIAKAPGSLANVFCPNTDRRYAALCERAKTDDPRFFQYGKDTAGERDGIWVNYDWIVGGVVSIEKKDWSLNSQQLAEKLNISNEELNNFPSKLSK